MLREFLKNINKWVLILILIGALASLGTVFNAVVPWIWLTHFFTIIINISELFSFIVDLDTLWTIVGIVITLEVALWSFKAVMWVVKWFNN